MTLIDSLTVAIRECEIGEDRAAGNNEVIRYKLILRALNDARDELMRAAPIVPRRETLTLDKQAAA